ncbi:hypothetical protein EOL96_02675 [Candidatus Saccharibacteria bacterium]|nr:hypothetical protein [Candidatus Saccharibacteria bacterium]
MENYFILGLLLSLTPGPVVVETIQKGLSRDSRIAQFIVGTYLGTGVVACLSLSGINLLDEYSWSRIVFLLVNTLILLYIGSIALRVNKKYFYKKQRRHHDHPLVNGFLMAATSLSRWVVWLSVGALIRQQAESTPQVFIGDMLFAAGSFMSAIFIALVARYYGLHATPGTIVKISKTAGFAIIMFAMYGVFNFFW